MSRALTTALVFAFLLTLMPLAGAQVTDPVSGCSKNCTPKEVNGEQPKRGDETVKAVLYGHFQDILNRAPLNTQIPAADKEENLNRGFLMPVVSTRTGTDADLRFENNWFYMFSSAGFVEIVDGQWRTHQEPGLAEEVKIVGNEILLYFYLSAYPVPNGDSDSSPTGHNVVSVMPQVGIYARMETGRNQFRGQLIAEGDTGAGDTAGRVNVITVPGSNEDIYEFEVPMRVVKDTIPDVWNAPGFLVSINPYQIKGKDGSVVPKDWQVMQSDWRVRLGPKTPPRLIIETEKAMVTKAASLSLFNNAMFVRWSFISPWGSYDIDDRTLQIHLEGPSNPAPDKVGLSRPLIVKRSVDHDAHFKPVNATWRFDYQRANLADGDYKIHLSIMNLQNTYVLQEELAFKVRNGVPTDLQIIGAPPPGANGQQQQAKGDSPGLAGFAALASLFGAAVILTRRRRF
jgi:hypothetical protein